MKTIIMTHEDGSQIRISRKADEVARTIEFARQCGYVRFEIV